MSYVYRILRYNSLTVKESVVVENIATLFSTDVSVTGTSALDCSFIALLYLLPSLLNPFRLVSDRRVNFVRV